MFVILERRLSTFRAIETSKLQDEYFGLQWLWLAYWEFIYFACVLSVTIIWRPAENNKLYAYSTQLSQGEGGTSEVREDDVMVKLEDMGEGDEREEGKSSNGSELESGSDSAESI
jgi:hypothetical protein